MNEDFNESSTGINKWHILIGVLLLVCVLGYVGYTYKDKLINMNPNSEDFELEVCTQITGTPTWIYENGTIAAVGYIPFGVEALTIVNNYLIPNKIYFVYSSNCGYCAKQVQEFGETWNTYVKSGLTIDCLEVFTKFQEQQNQ